MLQLPACFLAVALAATAATPGLLRAREGAPPATLAPGSLRAEDLLRLADSLNPDILAARRRVEAARGRGIQAGLLPNPSLEVRDEDVPVSPYDGSMGRTSAVVSQPLPLGGRLRAARSAAEAEVAAAEAEYHDVRHVTFGQVHGAWTELVYLAAALRLQFELAEVAEETVRQAEGRPGATQADVARLRLDARRVEQAKVALASRSTMGLLRLQGLLGGTPLTLRALGGELAEAFDLSELAIDSERAVEGHPRLESAVAALNAAQWGVRTARAERIPDLEVMVGGGNDRGSDETFAEAGIRIPIPLFNRNQGTLAERRALEAQKREAVEGLRAQLLSELRILLQSINEWDTLSSETREELVPEAWGAFEAVRADYQEGRAAVQDLLDAQRQAFQTRQTALEYTLELNMAFFRLRHFLRDEGFAP